MKNLLKLLLIILVFTSCRNSTENYLEPKENEILISKENLIDANLGSKFNIDKDVYNEFIESATFENGRFVGAIFDGIEEELDDKTSMEFWANFNILIRNIDEDASTVARTSGLSISANSTIFKYYKPKPGGCKANNRWICVVEQL